MSQFKPFGDLPRRMPRPSHAKGMQFDTPPHSPPFMDVGIPPSYQRLLSSSPVDSKALSRGDDACSIVTDSSSIRQRPASRAASVVRCTTTSFSRWHSKVHFTSPRPSKILFANVRSPHWSKVTSACFSYGFGTKYACVTRCQSAVYS